MSTAQFSRDLIHTTMETLPNQVPDGVREIALATVLARESGFAHKLIVEVLHKLSTMENWDGEFLVTCPVRQYFD